jgi:hypothetical protein
LSFIPPFDQFLARISTLRKENDVLRQELEQSQQKLRASSAELKTVTKALWVAPGHFYSPIPDLLDLEMSSDEIFEIPPAVRGIDLNDSRQLELLKEFRTLYADQPFSASKVPNRRYFFDNPNSHFRSSRPKSRDGSGVLLLHGDVQQPFRIAAIDTILLVGR